MNDLNQMDRQMHESRLHHFVAEASSLELAPGDWPRTIETNRGNGQPFVMIGVARQDGELVAVEYRQACGCITLTVFND
jgi:hypothetical protein